MMKGNLSVTILLMVLLTGLTACQKGSDPVQDPVFTSGYAVYYGPYYKDKGISADVWGMELYTEGLNRNDSTGAYSGSGYLITFTDIFADNYKFSVQERIQGLPSHFPVGEYSIDTTYQAGTMIAGERRAGYDLGAYVATISDGATLSTTFFDKGSILVTDSSVVFNLHRPGYAKRFTATFSGRLSIK